MRRLAIALAFAASAMLAGSSTSVAPAGAATNQASASVRTSALHKTCHKSGYTKGNPYGHPDYKCHYVGGIHQCGAALSGQSGSNPVVNCVPIPPGTIQKIEKILGENLCPLPSTMIQISGTNLDLTEPGALIFRVDPSTGSVTEVSAITSPGDYLIVTGTCTPSLPPTGGGAA
jgi:hypothetical protein